MHAGHWDKATHKSVELHGRTIGLVGLGAIGQRFARMCDAMGMKVLGFDPFAKDLPEYIRRGGPGDDLAGVRRDLAALPADAGEPRLRQCADAGLVQARA